MATDASVAAMVIAVKNHPSGLLQYQIVKTEIAFTNNQNIIQQYMVVIRVSPLC